MPIGDLVAIVTAPNYPKIDDRVDLAKEVGRRIFEVATGQKTEQQNTQGADTVNEPVAGWQPFVDGSKYCYLKGQGQTDYTVKVCSENGWPVWIRNADDWQDKGCDDLRNLVQSTYPADDYQRYLLTVKFKGSECEGLQGYGVAYIEHWQNMMNPLKNPAGIGVYAAACGTTTTICYAAMTAGTGGIGGALSIGKWLKDLGFCALAPALGGWFASQQIAESKTKAQASFILAQTLGTGELITAKYAVLPTVQISRLRGAIRGGADLVKAVSKDTAKFDDFVKLGLKYTETADQFEKIASQFPRLAGVRSAGAFVTDDADDILRLLAAYGKTPSAEKLVEIGSRLKIRNAAELAKTEAGKEKLIENIVTKLQRQKIGDAANKAFKGMDDELRNIAKREFKASFVCGAAGAVAGTLSYYALIAETGTITTPNLTVEIDNIFDAMSVAVSNNRIDVGA
ncbi:hypothetical protein CL1_0067 [Thermococcus cleftensis]|uniref:Uncharacterized protein n=2 Tax=Thermococcus cleftensis (strain DSM 27260 / KACC 17922 / CL1) TaxID=163003 RepID=I3ZRE8_THECF|nr:hypothetical protein CL1_0067 [Thermococcus cleftensis]